MLNRCKSCTHWKMIARTNGNWGKCTSGNISPAVGGRHRTNKLIFPAKNLTADELCVLKGQKVKLSTRPRKKGQTGRPKTKAPDVAVKTGKEFGCVHWKFKEGVTRREMETGTSTRRTLLL